MQTATGAPPAQEIEIRNGGTGSLNWTLTVKTADGGNWLTASSLSGTAPSIVTAGVSVANLPGAGLVAGTYSGQLLFRSASSSVTVSVTVVVGANVFYPLGTLAFTKPVQGANPLPQTLVVASTGTNFYFSALATTATGGNWLSVSPTNASENIYSPSVFELSRWRGGRRRVRVRRHKGR